MPEVSRTSAASQGLDSFPPPAAIAGIAGLYDLPTLVYAPGQAYEPFAPIYKAFMIGAFGSNEKIWIQVSPALMCKPATTWPSGAAILLSASKEDTLVPYAQLESIQAQLVNHWSGHPIVIEHFAGDHNDAWQDGIGVANAVASLVAVLVA